MSGDLKVSPPGSCHQPSGPASHAARVESRLPGLGREGPRVGRAGGGGASGGRGLWREGSRGWGGVGWGSSGGVSRGRGGGEEGPRGREEGQWRVSGGRGGGPDPHCDLKECPGAAAARGARTAECEPLQPGAAVRWPAQEGAGGRAG